MKSLDCLTKECIELLHKNRLLKPLISAELLKEELSNIIIESELKDDIVKNFTKKLGLSDKNSYDLWLAKNSMNKTEFENLALKELKIQRFCQKNLDHKIEQHFLERKAKLDIVVYSLIRVSSIYIARELFSRLVHKEDEFGDLAESYSDGIEKNTRGVIGPCTLDKAHPKLAQLLRSSEPGKISGPCQIDNYFVIIRLESYTSAKLDDFMREKMGIELFEKLLDSRVNESYVKILNSHKSKEMIGEQI